MTKPLLLVILAAGSIHKCYLLTMQVLGEQLGDLFNSLTFVMLAGSPLHCNCELRWFRLWLTNDTVSSTTTRVLDSGDILCVSPPSMTGLPSNSKYTSRPYQRSRPPLTGIMCGFKPRARLSLAPDHHADHTAYRVQCAAPPAARSILQLALVIDLTIVPATLRRHLSREAKNMNLLGLFLPIGVDVQGV